MSYQLRVLKDKPLGFWLLDESSGTTAFDYSGSGNNGTYTGSLTTNIMPMVLGGVSATKISQTQYITLPITKNYYGLTQEHSLATKYCSDNHFSLEIWVKTEELGSAENVLFGDSTSNIGIFWQNGLIKFKLNSDSLTYLCNDIPQVKHIVCTYTQDRASIYLDGILVATKDLITNYSFTNESFQPTIGPAKSGDVFYVDAPAIYRYALSQEQIASHYLFSETVPLQQVVKDDNGDLIILTDFNMQKNLIRKYPADNPWRNFYNTDLFYNEQYGYISLNESTTSESKTVVIEDYFPLPETDNLVSSKIEWLSAGNVTIETSVDGINYEQCTNGEALPQFYMNDNSFSDEKSLYIKITLHTDDASVSVPRLYWINIYMYPNKKIYAKTTGTTVLPQNYLAGSGISDYDLNSFYISPIFKNDNSGLKIRSEGFQASQTYAANIKTIEMIFTPVEIPTTQKLYLFMADNLGPEDTYYQIGNENASNKSNLSKVYINGVERSGNDTATYFVKNEPHHVVLVVNNTGWNYGVAHKFGLNAGSNRHRYQMLAFYENELTAGKVLEHYNLLIGNAKYSVTEPAINMTEYASEYYNNDWVLVKSR
jgi:hypothetical protein